MQNKSLYLRIGIVMVLSFLVSSVFSQAVFVGTTPNLQSWIARNPIVAMVYHPQTIQPSNPPGGVSTAIAVAFSDVPYQQVSSGVFAKEKGSNTYVLVKIGQIEYKEYTFVVNDKPVKIRVPKDDPPPTQKDVEKMVQ